MARQIIVEVIGNSKQYTKALDDASGTTSSFGKKFDLTKGLILAGAGLVTGALLDIGKETFQLGAKYESMDEKAQTVFGDSLKTVDKWAKANAAAMGLTARGATGLATNMADLLIPMGFTRDAAAEMSTNTIGLAGALSEWSNGTKTAAEVSDILTKAMLGERDGLKALGISITEADVTQQLMKNGTDQLTGAALEQAKAIATQELIMAKSVDAQTAFANGADKGARSQAELTASLEEVKETLVTAVYPILKAVTGWLAANLPGAIRTVQGAFNTVRPHIETIVAVLGRVYDVVAKVRDFLIGFFVKAIGQAGDVFRGLYTVVSTTVGNITGAINGVVNFLSGIGSAISRATSGMWNGIWNSFKAVINSIIRGWNGLKFSLPRVDLGPLGVFGGFTIGTPNIPYLHAGGIVPGAAGSDVLSILQAGEVVIPRSDVGKRTGDIHIHIDNGAYIDGPSLDRLTNMIAARLRYASGV